jgi:secondary thiamine-phosphate synthase enzyme
MCSQSLRGVKASPTSRASWGSGLRVSLPRTGFSRCSCATHRHHFQENTDPNVRRDLLDAFEALAPEDRHYAHQDEGPDDMPSHIKAMLTAVSLGIPVKDGSMVLGTWQGVYLIEHRASPHQRSVVLSFIGEAAGA